VFWKLYVLRDGSRRGEGIQTCASHPEFLKTKMKKDRNLPNINKKDKAVFVTGRGGP
jgi:hypothetical protein